MSKRIVLGMLRFVVALCIASFFAIALETGLRVQTPGRQIARYMARNRIWHEPPPIGHSLEIMFMTDALLWFFILCIVYAIWSHFRRATAGKGE